MKIWLIRHGETPGNREHRYVGRTDEGLTEEAVRRLSGKRGPQAVRVYASPLRRCVETAALLYPGQQPVLCEELQECDFGRFEYCNYSQLNGDPDYQRFIDTCGESGFPGGENRKSFQERCTRSFWRVMEAERRRGQEGDLAFVVHGGTVMALLDSFSSPHRDYYDWQTGNGCGFGAVAEWKEDGLILKDVEEIKL